MGRTTRLDWRLAVLFIGALALQAEDRIPVVLDTDIGSAIDDAFALAYVLSSPELELRAVTTCGRDAEDRAWIVCRFLAHSGHAGVAVAWGRDPQPDYGVGAQRQYRGHPSVLFGRTTRPEETPAVDLLHRLVGESPGELTIVAIGPLTNIARLIERHPDSAAKIRRIVVMGGSLETGYGGEPPAVAEWNFRTDPDAARSVLAAGVPLAVAPLDATARLRVDEEQLRRLFAAATPLTFQLQALHDLQDGDAPVLFDPFAVRLAVDERFCVAADQRLSVDEQGATLRRDGPPNARVALEAKTAEFVEHVIERIATAGERTLPEPPGNRAALVDRGALPARVHVTEDYETDIEARWWLSGKLETENVPPGSRRACRAVVTRDFDDQQGDTSTSYRAVVFNPVPGPPVGARTRLSFRYHLRGTDTLRVQLYSLSNGYHRYLSVSGLTEESWQDATVDMTRMRRPDGTGGPLAADERIDDIQFYVDPRAELLIDDILLYEAAPPDESAPFPRRVVFTGWFDTGRQGVEWPGDFEIVPHEPPRTWKAARSVAGPGDRPWIRVDLRGRRPLGARTRLRFAYRLDGAAELRIVLADAASGASSAVDLEGLTVETWSTHTVDLDPPATDTDGTPIPFAGELRFHAAADAVLLVDDVLLFEPGE